MADRVTPIVFVGGGGSAPAEMLVVRGQQAAALDLIERVLQIERFNRPIVATGDPVFAERLSSLPVLVEPDEGDFHFGRRLRDLIDRHDVAHPFYLGGGSAPILTGPELAAIADTVLAGDRVLVANNFFSSDFVAFSPGSALGEVDPPRIDNDLAFSLQRQAGLKNVPLPRTASTQLDLDTPTDLAILQLHPDAGPNVRRLLDAADLDTSRLRAAMRCLTDPSAEIVVAGRVSTQVLAHLDTDLACRKRVFSEERGMRASGRESRGEVRSLLGFYLESVGPARFFASLAELGQALFLDTRVIFHHLGLRPSAADRFGSDLLDFEGIQDPVVRELTRAAAAAPVPVLLGGHSLVSGGLWALIDLAWQERDRELAEAGQIVASPRG